jgi:hypothetical protein
MDYVNALIQQQIDFGETPRSQVQTQAPIHPEIFFRYNTINLLVSRRGVGKTFTVMKKMIKISQLPNCGGYTTFLYVSDKTNDETVNEMIKLIKLKVRQVSYKDLLQVLHDLIDAKNAYANAIENGVVDKLSKEVRDDILNTLYLEDFRNEIPHTAILLDDAINILRENKFKPLVNVLFQNRQPRLTVFICIQGMYGVSPQLRRNCDTIFLFAGMTDKHLFGTMMSHLGIKISWDFYKNIPYRCILIIDYTKNGEEIRVVDTRL